MSNKFENQPKELTSEEKFKLAKERHPDPRSIKDRAIHEVSELKPVQDWLEDRADIIIDRSGTNETIENFAGEEIKVVDVGGGKGHIMREVIKDNPDKEIKTAEIDLSDYASKKVSESDEGEKMDSVFGEGENMPIKDKSVEMATAYFTFQELDNNQQSEILEEMKRIIKDNGRIVIVDEPSQEEKTEGIIARSKNILRNWKVSKFNLHSEDEWKKFFEDNELEVENSALFGDDEENKKEQFISYILKKKELTDENFTKQMFDSWKEQDIIGTPPPEMAMKILKEQNDRGIMLLFLVSNFGGGTREEAWKKLKEVEPTKQELRFLKNNIKMISSNEEKEILEEIKNLLKEN